MWIVTILEAVAAINYAPAAISGATVITLATTALIVSEHRKKKAKAATSDFEPELTEIVA